MKKFISLIASTVLTVSSLTAVSSFAVNNQNELSVSKTVLSSDVTADDGTVIPAGAVAINVNIDNNTGFSYATTVLELGSSYDVITDENNSPIVSTGTLLEDSIYSTKENNNRVSFANASGDEKLGNGLLFTIYAYEDITSSDNGIVVFDTEEVLASSVSLTSSAEGYYICGDVDDDDFINASDSSTVLASLRRTGRDSIPYDIAKNVPSFYFPNASTVKAAYLWGVNNPKYRDVDAHTAEIILDYYASNSAGTSYVPDEEDADGLLLGYAFPLD